MNTRERIERDAERRTVIMTSIAGGTSEAMDVDEWLYRANRLRSFVPRAGDYVPKHRGEVATA